MKRTPLARRNRIGCDECGDDLDDANTLKRTVRWGFWEPDSQSFDGAPREEHYCSECWQREFARDVAAHFEFDDGQQLWDILEAADGDLVADLRPIFVGGRPWIRVVDGELQALAATRDVQQRGDETVVSFDVEPADELDRGWFEEAFAADRDVDRPTIALLKPADETPFDDFEAVPEDQQTFDEVSER